AGPEAETERLYQAIRERRAASRRTVTEPSDSRASAEPSRSADELAPVHDVAPEHPTAKASIAVFPFVNLSADPEQDYFAKGIVEDLVTQLSRLRDLLVISRNSVVGSEGPNVRVQDVARELGVRYALEGSVRRAGNRLRVTAQLVDATTGGHVW